MTVNDRCKAVRQHANLSQRAFAERLSITGSSIALIETGKNNPSDQTLRLICQEFGISYAWLKEGKGEMLLPEDEDEAVNRIMLGGTDFQKALFRVMARLPDSAWEELQRFAEALKKESGL